MGRYEFYCPPAREWPARWRDSFLRLYDAGMDKVVPWRWMCSLILMPGSPSYEAVVGLREAALSEDRS